MEDLDRRKFIKQLSKMGAGAVGLNYLHPGFDFAKGPSGLEIKKKGTDPKNIVFILSDDHRYNYMSFLNTSPSFLETPNMDRMAANGAYMKNSFVSTSLCSPSRASILTGRYAHNHKVVDNQHLIPKSEILFPQYLQKAGYKTAFMGKWHMGHITAEPRPGFDRWISFVGQGTYINPTLNVDGKSAKHKGYMADILTDYGIDWIKKRENDAENNPFFLYLSFKGVHEPFVRPPSIKGIYADAEINLPQNRYKDPKYKPHWQIEARKSRFAVPEIYNGRIDLETLKWKYCETLYSIDQHIGQVLDYLEESGLADSTMVIYMSDNGFLMGEHGFIDKRNAYEESIRVPMLFYSPGEIEAGTEITQMVQNIDIAPTIMDVAGLATPGNMDGTSFLPLLHGEDIEWREKMLYEYFWEYHFPMEPTILSLRSKRYKYVFNYGTWSLNEFYDLKNDPEEMHNLIKERKQHKRIQRFRSALFSKLSKTGAGEGVSVEIPVLKPNRWWRLDTPRPNE